MTTSSLAHSEAAAAADSLTMETLVETFPQFDKEVLASVLATCDGNVEAAMEQVLAMGDGNAVTSESGTNADEELAMAIFQEFANELDINLRKKGTPIPEDVRNDPEKYHNFVLAEMQKLESKELEKRLGKMNRSSFMSRFSRGSGGPVFKPSSAPVFRQLAVERASDKDFDAI